MGQGHNPGKFLSAPLLAALTVSVATTKVNNKNQDMSGLFMFAPVNLSIEIRFILTSTSRPLTFSLQCLIVICLVGKHYVIVVHIYIF